MQHLQIKGREIRHESFHYPSNCFIFLPGVICAPKHHQKKLQIPMHVLKKVTKNLGEND